MLLSSGPYSLSSNIKCLYILKGPICIAEILITIFIIQFNKTGSYIGAGVERHISFTHNLLMIPLSFYHIDIVGTLTNCTKNHKTPYRQTKIFLINFYIFY
jgi:hypothetical protein